VILSGCATWEAVTTAPPEFWLAGEQIAGAFVSDVVSVFEFLLLVFGL
jgi:hypothetical protein